MSPPRRQAVTVFLTHQGRILLVRRSQRVGSYRGCWAGVSGYLEPDADPLDQARVELSEETGLSSDHIALLRRGEPLEVPDPELDVVWRVHPFLFSVADPARIRLDWENVEQQWIAPEAVAASQPAVPRLADTFAACWPPTAAAPP
ncbi:MAG: NUDIX pyrophosphatase [Magnetococcales bacterium]|nr:NUDIX pyrophosphatase [Magnetococcales bacterium]